MNTSPGRSGSEATGARSRRLTQRTLRWLVAVSAALTCLCALGGGSALAQSEEDMARFESHVKTGSKLLEQQQYERAIEELNHARSIIDHPRIVYSIADAHQQWGRCARAERGYRSLLERDDVNDQFASAIDKRLDSIAQCTETTTLVVECEPSSATLSVAGESKQCPAKVDLPVGDHDIRIDATGYHAQTRSVSLEAENTTRERVTLMKQRTSSDADRQWMSYAGWGAIGVGAGLLVWGGIADYGAVDRADELAAAREAGRDGRVNALLDEADSSRTTTILLYSGGAALVGGGLALHWLAPDSTEARSTRRADAPRLELRARGLGAQALVRW